MRLGGPILTRYETPEAWVAALQRLGYRAAYAPVGAEASDAALEAYAQAAAEADIVIAEVGAWSNPMSPDAATREAALEHCKRQLGLADRLGARCCVNIAGSCGAVWDGPHPDNLTEATFQRVVATVQEILDAVQPTRTYYALETMPWMYPDSPESYARLIEAVGRERFAVHLDPANLLCSPQRWFGNAELIRGCFRLLGAHIRSCHAKDVALGGQMTTHLDEVAPGEGGLDYATFLQELEGLDADTPLMLEHLQTQEEYGRAAAYVRRVAEEVGVRV
ncbi:MAG: sugar phosphate isomerase/epimerase family protein [Anaerolineae bacterium]